MNGWGLTVATSEADGLGAPVRLVLATGRCARRWGWHVVVVAVGLRRVQGQGSRIRAPVAVPPPGADDEQPLNATARPTSTIAVVVRTSPSIGQASGRRLSVSSTKAATARADRDRPSGPVRKTSRRTCRSPDGVETAIETAVSPVRGRVRTATPTSAPPSSRARRANGTRPGRARWAESPGSWIVPGPGCRSRSWAWATGASGAMISSKRNQGASPSSAARLPPVPISTAASVQPSSPSRTPIASLQVVSPVAQTYEPTASRTVAAASSTSRSAGCGRRPSLRCGRRPPRPERRWRRSGWSREGAARRGGPRPVTRRSRSADRSATRPRRRSRGRGGAGSPRRPTWVASRAVGRAAPRPRGHRGE